MADLFIHIGMQKTGTTYLQRGVSKEKSKLKSIGIVYPSTIAGLSCSKPTYGHHWLAHAIRNQRRGYTPNAPFSDLEKHANALNEVARTSDGDAILISSEDFSSFNEQHIERLSQLLDSGIHKRIVVYVRRQDQWLESYFSHLIRVGRRVSIETYLDSEQRRLDYYAMISRWAEVFGKENIIVRPYGEGYESLWRDFFESIGKAEAGQFEPKIERSNETWPPELLLFAFETGDLFSSRRNRRILERISDIFISDKDSNLFVDPKMARDLMARFDASNRKLAREMLGREALFANEELRPFRDPQDVLNDAKRLAIYKRIVEDLVEKRKKKKAGPDKEKSTGL